MDILPETHGDVGGVVEDPFIRNGGHLGLRCCSSVLSLSHLLWTNILIIRFVQLVLNIFIIGKNRVQWRTRFGKNCSVELWRIWFVGGWRRFVITDGSLGDGGQEAIGLRNVGRSLTQFRQL